MEFSYDLIEDVPDRKKKGIYYAQLISGILIFLTGLMWLNDYYSNGYSTLSLITGLICTLGGGLQTYVTYKNGLLRKGDAYYQIDGNTLRYKLNRHTDELNINLDEIKSIILGGNELILKRKNLEEIFLKTVFINKDKKSQFIKILKQKIES